MPAFCLPTHHELSSEIEIKRSRFITRIARVSSADDARQFINAVRDEFPDARHHCNAYIISVPGAQPLAHSSDDGEPSGTAGRPMLDVLQGFELEDVVAVVVRYFGGTLLGTGGLVRAYSDAVRGCLAGAAIVRRIPLSLMSLRVGHANAGKVEADLRAHGYDVTEVRYESTGVVLEVAVDDCEDFQRSLAELTAGATTAREVGQVIRDVPAGSL